MPRMKAPIAATTAPASARPMRGLSMLRLIATRQRARNLSLVIVSAILR